MSNNSKTLVINQEIISDAQTNITGELYFSEKGLYGETKEQIITLFNEWQDVIYKVAETNGFYQGDAVKLEITLRHCFGDRVVKAKYLEEEIPFNDLTEKVYFNVIMGSNFKTMEEHIADILTVVLQFIVAQDKEKPFRTGDWLEYEMKVTHTPENK